MFGAMKTAYKYSLLGRLGKAAIVIEVAALGLSRPHKPFILAKPL